MWIPFLGPYLEDQPNRSHHLDPGPSVTAKNFSSLFESCNPRICRQDLEVDLEVDLDDVGRGS